MTLKILKRYYTLHPSQGDFFLLLKAHFFYLIILISNSGRFVYYTVALYLITIFSIQFLLKIFRIKGFRLDFITAIHNLFLCFWSLVMFLGVLYDFSISNVFLFILSILIIKKNTQNNLFNLKMISKVYMS